MLDWALADKSKRRPRKKKDQKKESYGAGRKVVECRVAVGNSSAHACQSYAGSSGNSGIGSCSRR